MPAVNAVAWFSHFKRRALQFLCGFPNADG